MELQKQDRRDKWIEWYVKLLPKLIEEQDKHSIERVYRWMAAKLLRSHKHYGIVLDYYVQAMRELQ